MMIYFVMSLLFVAGNGLQAVETPVKDIKGNNNYADSISQNLFKMGLLNCNENDLGDEATTALGYYINDMSDISSKVGQLHLDPMHVFRSPDVGDKRKRSSSLFSESLGSPTGISDLSSSNKSNGKQKSPKLSPSQINDRLLRELNSKTKSTQSDALSRESCVTPEVYDKDKYADIATPDLLEFGSKAIHGMQETPNNRKKDLVQAVGSKYAKAVASSVQSAEEENNVLYNDYIKPKKSIDTILKNSDYFASPMKQQLSAVDMNHVRYPQVVRDVDGLIEKINGGHDIQKYIDNGLLAIGDEVFVANENFINVKINNKVAKSFYAGFDPNRVVHDLKKSKTIAQTKGYFKISKSPAGYYVGAYENTKNPLLLTSQFPIIMLTNENSFQDILIGYFAQLDADGSVLKGSQQEPLYISASEFENIMNHVPLDSEDNIPSKIPHAKVCKITKALEDRLGVSFPTPIYGIKYY